MQSISRTEEGSKILDTIINEDAELRVAAKEELEKLAKGTTEEDIKIASSMIIISENLSVTAMSKEEILENLKKLNDPEIAKQVGDALKSAISGEEVKIAKLPAAVGPILMALMAFLGPLFAQDADLKADMSNALKLKTVELADVNQFKQNLEKTDDFMNTLNEVIRSKTGRDIPGFASTTIGGQKLTARNKNQADMLKPMAQADAAMKANKAKGLMSQETYEKKIQAMIKAFNTMRPVVM